MRTHADYALFSLWAYGPDERALVVGNHLSVARFELVERDGVATGWLDLFFEDEGRRFVVPGILIDSFALARNDPRAFVYPRAAEALLDDAAEAALTDRLLDDLRALARRTVSFEEIVRFRAAPAFDTARAAGELGAAPLEHVVPRIARASIAIRRATGGAVRIDGSDARLGAALAARLGVAVVEAPSPDWYTLAPAAAPVADVVLSDTYGAGRAPLQVLRNEPTGVIDGVSIEPVPIVAPAPVDLLFSASEADGPVTEYVWVATPSFPTVARPERAPVRMPPLEVVIAARPDVYVAPGADTDEILEFATRFAAAGSTAHVAVSEGDIARPGVGVAWGRFDDPHVQRAAARWSGDGRGFAVISAPEGPFPPWYEPGLEHVVRAPDERERGERLAAFDRGLLTVSNVPPETYVNGDAGRLGAHLEARCFVALAATDAREYVRQRLGAPHLQAQAFAPLLPPADPPAPARLPFGDAPFVLMHASGVPESAAAACILALRHEAIPLVVATNPVDPAWLAPLRRAAGPSTLIVADPDPEVLAALYAHATIFVDPSVRSRGLARLVRAGRAGAIPVVMAASPAARLLPPEFVVGRPSVWALQERLVWWWRHPGRTNRQTRMRELFASLGSEFSTAHAFGDLCRLFHQLAAIRRG